MKLSKSDQAKSKRLYDKMVKKPYEEPARLSVSAKQLPDIKEWEVSKTYEIKIKMKMVSKSEGGYNGKQPLRAEFTLGGHDPYASEGAVENYDD